MWWRCWLGLADQRRTAAAAQPVEWLEAHLCLSVAHETRGRHIGVRKDDQCARNERTTPETGHHIRPRLTDARASMT